MVSLLIHKKPPGSHTGPSVKPKAVATVSNFSLGAISFENSGVRGSRTNEDFDWATQRWTMARLTTARTAITNNHLLSLAMSPRRGFGVFLSLQQISRQAMTARGQRFSSSSSCFPWRWREDA